MGGAWHSRVTEIENMTDQALELRECAVGDPDEGRRSHPIRLYPGKSKWISATKFFGHSSDGARPRCVKLVSSDPETVAETFDTTDFIHFKKFVIFREETGKIGVHRYYAEGIGFGRIKLVKCLRSFIQFNKHDRKQMASF